MKHDPCGRPLSETRCALQRGHDGLCCTGMEASLVAKAEQIRDDRDEARAERDSLRAQLATSEAARQRAEGERDAAREAIRRCLHTMPTRPHPVASWCDCPWCSSARALSADETKPGTGGGTTP
jgi:hypothetical protein